MTGTASRKMGRVARCSLVALALGLIGCPQDRIPPPKEEVPGPDFSTSFDSTTPAQIRDYVHKKLRFDPREGSSDERALPLGCPSACREGPIVAILPEERTHNNGEAALKGQGRIIAMLINRDPKQEYARYNLGPGDTVYWAIEKVKRVGPDRLEGRSLFISEQGMNGKRDSAVVYREMYIDDHPGQKPDAQGLARWVPRKDPSQGASVAPFWGLGPPQPVTRDQSTTPAVEQSGYSITRELMAWNNCKSVGCCRS